MWWWRWKLKQGERSADGYSPSPVMLDILRAACSSDNASYEAPLWGPGCAEVKIEKHWVRLVGDAVAGRTVQVQNVAAVLS